MDNSSAMMILKTLSLILKPVMDLIHWFEDKYLNWKEGIESGVGSPDEDIPINAKPSSHLMKCAGAFWRPYISEEVEVFLPTYLSVEVGPFCLSCKAPVFLEGRSLWRPYFKWRCPNNHIHKIPSFYKNDLRSKVKVYIQWVLKKGSENLHH